MQLKRTFFLHLALNIWVINDFTQGHAAEQWTQDAFSPTAAVRTVEDSHAEVTGEVGPLSEYRVLQMHRSNHIKYVGAHGRTK